MALGKKWEIINLLFPFIFIFLAIMELTFHFDFTRNDLKHIDFISKIVFLNHSHIFLSISMFIIFPEFRAWNHEMSLQRHNPLKLFATIFILLFALAFAGQFGDQIYRSSLLLVSLSVGFYHNVFQSYGFISLYSQEDNPASADKSRRVFKRICYLISIFVIASTSFRFFNPSIELKAIGIKTMVFLSSCTAIAGVFYSCFGAQKHNIYRTFYLFRFFLYALSPISKFAMYGYLSSHGLEYLLLYLNMKSFSKTRFELLQIIGFSIAFILFLSIPRILSFFPGLSALPASLAGLIRNTIFASTMTHYFMDSVVYKFRDPICRKYILGLFQEKTSFAALKRNAS